MMNSEQIKTIDAYDISASKFHNTIAQLTNYNDAYDCLLDTLQSGDSILDLACGTGNISSYLSSKKPLSITGFDLSEGMLQIAKAMIPNGNFFNQTIIDFETTDKFNAVINGFGLPYLNETQVLQSLQNSVKAMSADGHLYISFMDGDFSRWETPSFNHDVQLHIFYHKQEKIIGILNSLYLVVTRKWELDYQEEDGSVTKDIVIIAKRQQGATVSV